MTLRTALVAAGLISACFAATACAPPANTPACADRDLGPVPCGLPHPQGRLGCQHLPAIGPTACRLVRLTNGKVAVVPANLVGPSTVLWPVP